MRIHVIAVFAVVGILVSAVFTFASSPFDIEFPIPELNNCADKNECKQYCDDLIHKDACTAFGEKHGLISSDEAERSEQLPPTGPGGCSSATECRAYCEDALHIEECVAFGEAHNLINKKEVEQARELIDQTGPGGCRGASECRAYCDDAAHGEECLEFANRKGLINARELEVARSLKEEGGPGDCKTPDACRTYCQDPAHLSDCVDSAVEHGFMSAEEAVRVKKQHVVEGPGGCRGASECRAYCDDAAHQEKCISFGERNGFMSPEEAQRARALFGKPGPGGCRGEECRAYCETPEHGDECIAFAEQSGTLPPAELERAKKFQKISQEGGPGGCRGQECRTYCEDPANQSECFNFAKENGLIRPEEARHFETARKLEETVRQAGGPGGCKGPEECRTYCTDAAHAEECVAFGVAHGGLPEAEVRAKLKEFSERRLEAEGGFRPPEDFRRFAQQTQQRFDEFQQLEQEFRGAAAKGFGQEGTAGFPGGGPRLGGVPGEGGQSGSSSGSEGGFIGPGGCASPTECIKFCTSHRDECFSSGQVPPPGREGEGGRGGPRPECCPAPGELPIKLRGGLIHEFKPGELPQNFQQLSPEERQNLFRQKFENPNKFPVQPEGSPGEFPGRPGQFPGKPLQEFPGRPGEFPGRPGEFPARPPQEFPGGGREFPGTRPSGEGFEAREGGFQQEGSPSHPSFEGFSPRPGTTGIFSPLNTLPPPMPFALPPGETFTPPPSGSFTPPPTFTPPPSFTPPPPPSDSFSPPPPPPSSSAELHFQQGVASLLYSLFGAFGF